MQKIIERQKDVQAATAQIASAVRTFSANRAAEAEKEKQNAEEGFISRLKKQNDGSYEAFSQLSKEDQTAVLLSNDAAYRNVYDKVQDWGIGGGNSRALNAATNLITGALGGQTNLQAAANAVAPYAAATIGNTFGHGGNKNEAAQMVGHFLLGATLAYINGADPLSGGSAAVAAEKAAQYLSNQYNDGKTAIDPITGEFNPNLLPEHIKKEISATGGVIAAFVGATGDGGAAFNAQVGGVLGQNAVENNDSGCTSMTALPNCATTEKRIIQEFKKKSASSFKTICGSLSVNDCFNQKGQEIEISGMIGYIVQVNGGVSFIFIPGTDQIKVGKASIAGGIGIGGKLKAKTNAFKTLGIYTSKELIKLGEEPRKNTLSISTRIVGEANIAPVNISGEMSIGVEGKIRKPQEKSNTKTFSSGEIEASIGKSWGTGANIRLDVINFEWRNQ